jgi:hypothetical protein
MSFTIKDSVRSGAHELGERWTVDRHLYLTEDKTRVVEEGDPAGRWLWAAPGRVVPLEQAKRLGAIKEPEADEEVAEVKQPAENKMAAPKENKADAKTVRAWAKQHDVEVPAKGRIPDEVYDAYEKANG